MLRYASIAAGVALALLALYHPAPRPPESLDPSPVPSAPAPAASRRSSDSAGATIVVYVAGAVRRPGLYRLPLDARADDALARAGGFTNAADAAGVNLAERLEDGEEVEVPERGAPARSRRGHRVRHHVQHRRRRDAGVVDLNRADVRALGSIPGIGAAIAQRSVDVRAREGPYASLDELLDVAGMNEARLERARPHLVL